VTAPRAPRYRVLIYELRDGKTTQVADTYGNGFITAVATLDDDILEVHFNKADPSTSNTTTPPRSPTTTRPTPANALPSLIAGLWC